MKIQRNMAMLVGGGIYAVLIGAAAFLLVRGVSRFAESERARDELRSQLIDSYRANPFPSDQNVARERENVKSVEAALTNLLALLQRGQSRRAETSPATFMTELSTRRNEMKELAERTGVVLAPDLGFSMARYLGRDAMMPAPDHVARLMEQLTAVERIVSILFEERISELTVMRREEFEVAGPAAAALPPPRAGQPKRARGATNVVDTSTLYSTLKFTLEFKSKEKALIGLLNRIAADDAFMVVRRLDVVKDSPDVQAAPGTKSADEDDESAHVDPPSAAAATAEAEKNREPALPKPRRERIVAGLPVELPAKIVMDVEVYRFKETR